MKAASETRNNLCTDNLQKVISTPIFLLVIKKSCCYHRNCHISTYTSQRNTPMYSFVCVCPTRCLKVILDPVNKWWQKYSILSTSLKICSQTNRQTSWGKVVLKFKQRSLSCQLLCGSPVPQHLWSCFRLESIYPCNEHFNQIRKERRIYFFFFRNPVLE